MVEWVGGLCVCVCVVRCVCLDIEQPTRCGELPAHSLHSSRRRGRGRGTSSGRGAPAGRPAGRPALTPPATCTALIAAHSGRHRSGSHRRPLRPPREILTGAARICCTYGGHTCILTGPPRVWASTLSAAHHSTAPSACCLRWLYGGGGPGPGHVKRAGEGRRPSLHRPILSPQVENAERPVGVTSAFFNCPQPLRGGLRALPPSSPRAASSACSAAGCAAALE